ncbi:MAG: hypothetical protein ACR2PT_16375 [Endozoicomonas sp.]
MSDLSIESRVENLESEVFQLRKVMHKKDENQHAVWNNLQEDLLELSHLNTAAIEFLQSDVSKLKADVSGLKADVSELKTDVSVLKTDVSVLKADMSELKADVSELKSDMRSIKIMLQTLTDQKQP